MRKIFEQIVNLRICNVREVLKHEDVNLSLRWRNKFCPVRVQRAETVDEPVQRQNSLFVILLAYHLA